MIWVFNLHVSAKIDRLQRRVAASEQNAIKQLEAMGLLGGKDEK